MGIFDGPRNATLSSVASCDPNFSNVRGPVGPRAILALISFSSVACSYSTTYIRLLSKYDCCRETGNTGAHDGPLVVSAKPSSQTYLR